MELRFATMLLLLSGVCQPCIARQDVPSVPVEESPHPSPDALPQSVFAERPVSWVKLVPNLARDQKDIWLFPISHAVQHHLKPVLVVAAITAGTVAAVDVPSGKYFQRTRSFYGFNRAFRGKNTSIAMFTPPSVHYGITRLPHNSSPPH